MQLRYMRPTKAFTLCLLMSAALLGLFYGRFISADLSIIYIVACFAFFVRKHKVLILVALALACFAFGVQRAQVVSSSIDQYQQYFDTKLIVSGNVTNDPRLNDRGQIEFRLGGVEIRGEALPGTVRVSTFRAIGLQRGDRVTAEGTLRDGFASWQASMSFAVVESVGRSGNPVESIRREYFAGVYSTIAEPQASLGLGFLVGLRALLPDELLDELTATGLTHIVAVSGYNLTVLVGITKRWFAQRSRYVALVSSIGLITSFILVTGGAASIMRASVVTIVSLLAWYFGRDIKPMVILLISAVVTAFINPIFIWYDLGWWLSFLAFFGVLVLAPILQRQLFKKPPKLIGQTLIETTSAQIMALPLSIAIFGELSLISLLANVIILPLIPLAMLLTAIAGTAGVFAPHLAGWVSWPAGLILTFITSTVSVMARLPGSLVSVELSMVEMLGIYAAVLIFVAIASRSYVKRQSEFAILEDKEAKQSI